MQGRNKKKLVYSGEGCGRLKYPIAIQRANFSGPNPITRLFKQQYLICIVHHAMGLDMETPHVRLTAQAIQVLGIQPSDKVVLISDKGHKKRRCLTLDPKFELPSKTMKKTFAVWKCPFPKDKDLRLPWITLDRQTRLDLDVQPWQPIIVGRDPYHALTSEYSQVVLAVALGAVGGAIIVDFLLGQLVILLTGFSIVSILIWRKIRSRL